MGETSLSLSLFQYSEKPGLLNNDLPPPQSLCQPAKQDVYLVCTDVLAGRGRGDFLDSTHTAVMALTYLSGSSLLSGINASFNALLPCFLESNLSETSGGGGGVAPNKSHRVTAVTRCRYLSGSVTATPRASAVLHAQCCAALQFCYYPN